MMGADGMELGMRVAADERQRKQQDEESEKDEAHATKPEFRAQRLWERTLGQ